MVFSGSDQPPKPDHAGGGSTASRQELLSKYQVPKKVLEEGQGLVRFLGIQVQAIRLDDQNTRTILLSEEGITLGEMGDYLVYTGNHPINGKPQFEFISVDKWVIDFCER